MQDIYLCTITEIDLDNQRQIDFSSLSSQYNWFDKQNVKVIDGNVAVDTLTPTIDLNINLGAIKNYDYLWLIDENGKRIFYFIIGKKKKNTKCTIVLKCDVFQTYMFDYKIYDSFVERCHVPRWQSYNIPTMEIIDEGLPLGEYRYYDSEKIAKLNESYLVSSTTPLGFLKGSSGDTTPGTATGGLHISDKATAKSTYGNKKKGAKTVSKECIRYIKGYEGLALYGAKFNEESFNTAGYGIKEPSNPDYYNKLKPFPCSDSISSYVLASILNEQYATPILNRLAKSGVDVSQVSQCELDAMVSLSMNMGVGGFTGTKLYEKIVEYYNTILGPYFAKTQWLKTAITSQATGEELQGLKDRRKTEADIFIDALYWMRSITVYDENAKQMGILQDNDGDGLLPEFS